MYCKSTDVSDGSEDSAWHFGTMVAGSEDNNNLVLSSGKVGIGDSDPSEAKLSIVNATASTAGMKIEQGVAEPAISIDHNAANPGIYIDHDGAAGSSSILIQNPDTTTGNIIYVEGADALTTGSLAYFESSNTNSDGRFLVQIINDGDAAGASCLKLQQDGGHTDAPALYIDVNKTTTGTGILIDTEAETGNALHVIAPANTTSDVIAITNANALTTGAALSIESGGTALASTVGGGLVEVIHTADSDTNVNNLVFIKNNHADSTGTTGLYVQQNSTGPAISATGGIVEQGGVLKENLLTNSGFDVWSNSTLEDVTGTNLISSGGWVNGDNSGAVPYDTLTESGTDLSSVISDGSAVAYAKTNYLNMEEGKLYKATMVLDYNSGQNVEWGIGGTSDPGLYHALETTSGDGTYTKVVECISSTMAGTSANAARIWVKNGGATNWAATFTVTEVTPGCVAADDKACDGWGKDSSNIDVFRVHNDGGTLTKDGSYYAMKVVTAAVNRTLYAIDLRQDGKAEMYQRYAGRTVTAGCWVQTDGASHVKLRIYDGSDRTDSSYHSGTDDTWEWLEVTKTISASATNFRFEIFFETSGEPAYISQPMLVFGSSIGEGNYTRPQGEIVWMETPHRCVNDESELAADDKILNLEALSEGAVPKGAKAVQVRSMIKNTSITSGQGILYQQDSGTTYQLDNYPPVDNVFNMAFGWVTCDSNGDIYQLVNEAGDTLVNHHLDICAVQLR
jgi:hypothetical protein